MRFSRSFPTLVSLAQAFLLSECLHITSTDIDSLLLAEYDYVVVGGGASGLVIGNRLSEDRDVTVLVLEVGDLDTESYTVTVPAEVGEDLGTEYDWQLQTVEQAHLGGRRVEINQGKVVGGGTVLNGLVWTRGSRKDYDAWDDLNHVAGRTKKYGWRWNDMLPYFIKNENYTSDVDPELRETYQIYPQEELHGSDGFVQVSYPNYIYAQSANFLRGMEELGVTLIPEPNNGAGHGAFLAPSSLAADNQSRSDSRVAYADSAMDRPNLHLASQQMVQRILFDERDNHTSVDGSYRAIGVEFATSAQDASRTVNCTQEVILAAGAIFSPTLLQVSGIGPADELTPLGIPVKVDLPGVGSNAQDHGMLHPVYYYTNSSLVTVDTVEATNESRDAALDEYYNNRTGPLTAPMISTVAFPTLRQLTDDWRALLADAGQREANATLPAGTHPSVQLGYAVQRQRQLDLLADAAESAVEFLADSVGTLSVAMQRPLSRGTVRPAASASLFDAPRVDPRYCADPLDGLILARALRFNCALVRTVAMAPLQPVVRPPYSCPDEEDEDDENEDEESLLDLVKAHLTTEFHPSGTTAMLPRELGGVVDTDLRVYGTRNVRVVDAGVMPTVLGAHLQAAVYGIAERAADIIKEADI